MKLKEQKRGSILGIKPEMGKVIRIQVSAEQKTFFDQFTKTVSNGRTKSN